MRRLFVAILGCLFAFTGQAQQVFPAPAEFIVLRTDRVAVPTGESTHLNCLVQGLGDAAQISCETHTAGGGLALIVYHVALVVGSNQVGYVVSCGGGLVWRIRCKPLSAGQVLRGSVEGDKLSLVVGNKARTYRIETSAHIGPLTRKRGSDDATASPTPGELAEPSVKLAVEKSNDSVSSAPRDQPGSSANTAKVMVSSEPSGADVYVDGIFMGNTPSQIQLAAGSHNVRIEAKDHTPWSRVIALTADSKITIQAVLGAKQ